MDATLLDLTNKIGEAKSAQDVVGPNDSDRAKRLKKIRLVLHPDKWSEKSDRPSKKSDRQLATDAFATLEKLLADELNKTSNKFDITTRLRTYSVNGLAFAGMISNLYNCIYVRDDVSKSGLMKMTRSPADNDLLEQEAKVLKSIFKEEHRRQAFYPRLEETFVHRDLTTNVDRRTNILRRFDDFVSLADVKEAYLRAGLKGLDIRDLVWMWRRVYAGISLAHELGYVHGSLTPNHILIHPSLHGVQIVGWGQSVEIGDTIKLLGEKNPFFYPSEVLDKNPATPATDIYEISQTFLSLFDRNSPGLKQFRAFVKGTTYENASARPQDARVLLSEFDELMDRTFERKFREFKIPNGREL